MKPSGNTKKRKLIEMHQKYQIVCDNKLCDYKVLNVEGSPNTVLVKYLNMPCPKCSQILLTESDWVRYSMFLSVVSFINKWFSWLCIFSSKPRKTSYIHIHNSIKFEDVTDQEA